MNSNSEMVPMPSREITRAGFENLPAAIGRAGDAAWRFIEFFTATIRNKNTRAAYAEAVSQFFAWCERHRVRTLPQISPIVIATYIENHPGAAPTVKQHLAAIRMLFDFLVTGQIVPMTAAFNSCAVPTTGARVAPSILRWRSPMFSIIVADGGSPPALRNADLRRIPRVLS